MSSWEVIEPGEYKYPFALKVKKKKKKENKLSNSLGVLVSKCQFSTFF